MRIAQVAPLAESVPPKLYGGTERVVSHLTEELVAQGHRVVLYASGDSETSAELRACATRALRLDEGCRDPLAHHVAMLDRVASECDEFDIIHYHVDYLHFPLSRRLSTPHLTTLHGRLDIPDLLPLYQRFDDVPVVSISHAQRAPLPHAAWAGNVYHGLPLDLLRFSGERGRYLAFIGRLSREKGVDLAIEIATRTGQELKIAAKIAEDERDYYEEVRPLFGRRGIEYLGEIGEGEKAALLGGAAALLFPIDWPEPFGLVMIEAMACGTPVIAFRAGSVPEVVDEGATGIVCDSLDEAVAAALRVHELDRAQCRKTFEERFSAERMAADYVDLFRRLALPTSTAATHGAALGPAHSRLLGADSDRN
jgi:glycosyltransferase involved in cell wall biosynthesis